MNARVIAEVSKVPIGKDVTYKLNLQLVTYMFRLLLCVGGGWGITFASRLIEPLHFILYIFVFFFGNSIPVCLQCISFFGSVCVQVFYCVE